MCGFRGVGGGGQKAWIHFLTPPSRSTARLIEASMCLFQLFCSLSSFLPWSGQTHSASASTPPPPPLPMCAYVCACTNSLYLSTWPCATGCPLIRPFFALTWTLYLLEWLYRVGAQFMDSLALVILKSEHLHTNKVQRCMTHYLRFTFLELLVASSAEFGWCLLKMLGWWVCLHSLQFPSKEWLPLKGYGFIVLSRLVFP